MNMYVYFHRHYLATQCAVSVSADSTGNPGRGGGRGEIDFIRNNVFSDQGIDAAMMAHPWTNDLVTASGFLCRER